MSNGRRPEENESSGGLAGLITTQCRYSSSEQLKNFSKLPGTRMRLKLLGMVPTAGF